MRLVRLQFFATLWLSALAAWLFFHPGRWQLYPAAVAAAITLLRLRHFAPKRWPARVFVFPAFAAAVSASLCWLMPTDFLPPLSGPSRVATRVIHLKDVRRTNSLFEDETPREILVQAWYPTSAGRWSFLRSAYHPEAAEVWSALAHRYGVPAWIGWHLPHMRSRSISEGALADNLEPYPVVIFSPGNSVSRVLNTYLLEELASRGYVVLAIEHTYDAAVTVLPSGQRIFGRAIHEEGADKEERSQLQMAWLRTRVADVRFVMDHLAGIFPGKLDRNRVGVMGYAMGGETAAGVCSLDSRCKAGASLSGIPPVGISVTGTNAPFLFVQPETFFGGWFADHRPEAQDRVPVFGRPSYQVEIKGAAHGNFTDLAFLSPVYGYSQLAGPIDGGRALEITRDVLAEFFDASLRGKSNARLRQLASRIPEAVLRHATR